MASTKAVLPLAQNNILELDPLKNFAYIIGLATLVNYSNSVWIVLN